LRSHPQFFAYLALLAVCFFWGTTYLGIRIALESLSPTVLVSTRYLLSGAILLIVCYFSGAYIPRGRELLGTALFGVIILGIGNGCLAFAEQWVPSGLAAMFITTSPFWMLGIEAALPGGTRLHGPTILAMLVGLFGTLLLVAPAATASGFGGPILKGFLVLQFGCAGWSLGSILQRRHTTKAHPIVSGAVQQFATGLVYIVPAFLIHPEPIRWTGRGMSAVFYLVTFGSIVGYSAYIYALQNLPVSVVSLYNYVNPIVAGLLGFLVFREPFGLRELIAMAIIFLGIALVKRFSVQSPNRPLSEALPVVPEAPRSSAGS
jgi:drug/metabolite transporter (DMT)-like permease